MTLVFLIALVGNYYKSNDWIEALWMVVITISGTGFGERPDPGSHQLYQLFTVGVIIFGMSGAMYTFGGFIQMVMEGELEQTMGSHRRTRGIERLNNHVIICGFGRVGQTLAIDLHEHHQPFVVIENAPHRIEEIQARQFLFINGDATEDSTLLAAGIERAKAMVSALPADSANVFITLTSRNLNPGIQIISRADHSSTEKKLRQAGADKIVMPEIIGGQQMSRLITRPYVADMMELVAESRVLHVEMDELVVTETCQLSGVSIRDAQIHRQHGLLVIAVKQHDGDMVFSPSDTHVFQPGEVLIVMGPLDNIQQFRRENFRR